MSLLENCDLFKICCCCFVINSNTYLPYGSKQILKYIGDEFMCAESEFIYFEKLRLKKYLWLEIEIEMNSTVISK